MVDLADVVDQGKQAPLDIHLGFGAQGETIQTFLDADIGKYRLDDGQAPGIDLPALGGVDPGFHLVDQVGGLVIQPDRQVPGRCVWLAQTPLLHRAAGTIFLAGLIDIVKPVAIALAAGMAGQGFALGAEVGLFGHVKGEIGSGEPAYLPGLSLPGVDAIFESVLPRKALISFAELDVRDIGVQALCLASRQVGQAVIVAVCAELFACEIVWFFADGLHVRLCPRHHGSQVLMILAAESLGVEDDLAFLVHQRLGVVPLDHPVCGGHLC